MTSSLLDLFLSSRGIFLAAATLILIYIFRLRSNKNALPLPPGPKGLPIIGNLLDIIAAAQKGEQHLLFEKWARQYGELYRVKLGPVTQFMVNSDVAVKAIFDKPAAASANRPTWLVSSHHICNDWNVLLINANTPRWKQQRKLTWTNVGNIPSADAGVEFLEYETLKFLHELVIDEKIRTNNEALWNSIMRYTYSNFASQMFGLDIPDSDDPAIEYIHETGVAQILATLPGSHIVETLPFLDYLPLFLKPWEQQGRARFQRDFAWCKEKLERVKAMPERTDSLLSKIIQDPKHLGFSSPEEGAYFCLMLTIGAADTSQISTWAFLEAMMEFPAVQAKARKAIDEVVGDRLPRWSDYENIPYIRSLLKETWRHRPPVGLGHPHLTTAPIIYNSYLIPANSRICLNAYAIHHDPARHPDPHAFNPDRYAHDTNSTAQSLNSSDPADRDHFAFGAGRRVCPGYNVAERSLAVAVMRILWGFEVRVREGWEGKLDIADWRGDFPGLPGKTMPVVLVPREERREVIGREWERVKGERGSMEGLTKG